MELSDILALAERVKNALPQGLNEANTKTSLIMPFLQAMGYDVFNHTEVAQEYTSEFGTKKGEKVDIAILRDGEPVVLMECKPLGDHLDTGCCSQLFRYFTTKPTVRIGILTNGQRYLFFSDLERQNVMDNKPFMEIDILNFNERALPELQKLTKEAWDLDAALSSAETLKYTRAVKLLVAQDIQEPSESLVRHYTAQCYNGKMTHKVLDMFRPIVKRAFTEHVSDLIAKRLNSIQEAEESALNEPSPPSIKETCAPIQSDGIVTHNAEIWAYFIIRSLLSSVVEPARITLRDQKTYCGILLDDNNRKPICRLFNVVDVDLEKGEEGIGKNAYIIILTSSNDKGERHNLTYLDDIYPLAESLKIAVLRHEKKKAES